MRMDRLTEAIDCSLIFEEGDDAVLDAARVVLVDVVGREVKHEMRTHWLARLDRGLNDMYRLAVRTGESFDGLPAGMRSNRR